MSSSPAPPPPTDFHGSIFCGGALLNHDAVRNTFHARYGEASSARLRLFDIDSAAAVRAAVKSSVVFASTDEERSAAAATGVCCSVAPPRDVVTAWQVDEGMFSWDDQEHTDRWDDRWKFEGVFVEASAKHLIAVTYALFTRGVPVVWFTVEGNTEHDTITASLPQAVTGHGLFSRAILRSGDPQHVAEELLRHVASFYSPTFGRVFVIEGGDGSGKETQTKMLLARMQREGYPCATLDFPNDAARYGVLIREVIAGRKGELRAVSPQVFATLYGLNRHDTLPMLTMWLRQGRNVILDRYTSANFGHQASKLSTAAERIAAINSLKTFEEVWLGLPGAHRVVYLKLPPMWAMKAMMEDANRKHLDLHEQAAVSYKENVMAAFVWCCENLPGWHALSCTDEALTTRYSREDLHEQLFQLLKPEFVRPAAATTS